MGIYSHECPACGSEEGYRYYVGASDPVGPKLEPDTASCDVCGFFWSEHCNGPTEEEAAKRHAAEATHA